jgi:hypothetical protein
MDSYPASYTDVRGTEATAITNEGETLRMTIRDVEFIGTDFDALEPCDDATPDQLTRFSLNHNELCSCRIECAIPILINSHGSASQGTLAVELILGDPEPKGWLDREELHITLACDHGKFAGSGKSGWFEDELFEIQSKLPAGVFMQACINCLYSDYSPYGHGAFGCMMCFRNLKSEYLKVKSKADFWSVHDRYDRMVQETYLCPEFERRIPGTGYRG